jgi:hypothetical protein
MATIKSFTSLEQSRKLVEILPLESVDMCWQYQKDRFVGEPDYKEFPQFEHVTDKRDIACWSLAALLEQLPYELCDDDGNSLYLEINKEDDVYQLVYADCYGDFESIETDRYEHFVDACYEMILKLKESNLL